jgi:hypothetical protein
MRTIVTLLIVALLASYRIDDGDSNNDRLPAQYREAILEVMSCHHIRGTASPGRGLNLHPSPRWPSCQCALTNSLAIDLLFR